MLSETFNDQQERFIVNHDCEFKPKLDLESIGSSLGIDWELIWAGLDWSGPDILPGLYNRHLIIEGHRGIRRW